MRIKSLSLLAGLVLLGVAYPVGRTLGQAVYGSIIGTVTDSSGAAVPNAKVTITSVDKGVSVTTTSNESGNYEQQHLIAGTYDVKVEAPGFQTAERTVTVRGVAPQGCGCSSAVAERVDLALVPAA